MSIIKEDLISKIIEELKSEEVKDIASIIAPFYKGLEGEQFKEFLQDLEKNDFWVRYNKSKKDEYTNGNIIIQLQLNEADEYNNYWLNYNYEITFDFDGRNWGYCQCEDNDKDYDARYKCCGHGCDWNAPSFSLIKHINIGQASWQGDEHALWNFQDKFNNIDNKQLEEDKKQAQITYYEEQIKIYENLLEKSKNTNL